jgi:hypothetical protein
MHQLDPTALYKPFEHTVCVCGDVKFQYEGLNANEIRVLVVEPAQPEDRIRCRMIRCDLQYQPFEALSYTWGDESSRELIDCMGKPCCIPVNCALAIRKLRYPDRERYVWIDAICIDQHNIAERSAQVQLMSRVYHSASRTIIYLGETADDSDLALDCISSCSQQVADDRTTTAIQKLYKRPYFERIWVIQEVSMSRSAIVLCGNRSLPWFYLVAYARKLPWQPPVLSPMARLQRRDFIHFTTNDEFVKSLCEATLCQCRDPRDRIFAFMSMLPSHMSADEIWILKTSGFPLSQYPKPIADNSSIKFQFTPVHHSGTNLPVDMPSNLNVSQVIDQLERLPVNYRSSVESVFVNAATVLLHRTGLDFLSAMQGHTTTSKMPTWVPDWRVPSHRTILAHMPLSGFTAGGPRQNQRYFTSHTPSPSSHRTLVLSARKIGTIRHLGAPCDTTTSDWPTVVFHAWRLLAEKHSRSAPAHELHASFLNALFMDASDKFVKQRASLQQGLAVHDVHTSNTAAIQSLLLGPSPAAVQRLRTVLHGRRLFVTERGVLGVTTSESEVGDIVYIVLGAKVPYVFRKRDRGLELVGECFAQGYMKGSCDSGACREVEDICVV